MKNRIYYKIASFVLIFLILIGLTGCSDSSRTKEYTSPNGEHTIIVEYDLVSRPTVYEKTGLIKKKVFSKMENGYNESVFFEIEWIDDDTFRIYNNYFDEEYTIDL